jgi:hypothetical protein
MPTGSAFALDPLMRLIEDAVFAHDGPRCATPKTRRGGPLQEPLNVCIVGLRMEEEHTDAHRHAPAALPIMHYLNPRFIALNTTRMLRREDVNSPLVPDALVRYEDVRRAIGVRFIADIAGGERDVTVHVPAGDATWCVQSALELLGLIPPTPYRTAAAAA